MYSSWNFLFINLIVLVLTCKQNESSLELSSSEWSHLALSSAYTTPACNWCALVLLGLQLAYFFWKQRLVKCPTCGKLYIDIFC